MIAQQWKAESEIAKEADAHEKLNAISAVGQRRLIGYLGLALPVLCVLFTALVSGWWLPTISHYYYTPVHGAFTAILCGLGMVLYVYRGYDHWDNYATNFAATAAFGVGLFPTARGPSLEAKPYELPALSPLFIHDEAFNSTIHNISAISLFVMFFVITGFLFTRRPMKDGQPPTLSELVRSLFKTCLFLKRPIKEREDHHEFENDFHRRCAAGILLGMIGVLVVYLMHPRDSYSGFPWVGMFETISITAFALSWLRKNQRRRNFAQFAIEEINRIVESTKSFLNGIKGNASGTLPADAERPDRELEHAGPP